MKKKEKKQELRDDKYFLAEQKRSVRKMESIQRRCKSTFLQNWLPEKGSGEGGRAEGAWGRRGSAAEADV